MNPPESLAQGGGVTMAETRAQRTLNFHILRYNPRDPARAAHADLRARGSRRHDALHRAERDPREQDPSLQFDFVCRAGICGSCAMVINGRPTLACRTVTKTLPTRSRSHRCRCSS
jgi:fumarate reductase iron-sulfur subunit